MGWIRGALAVLSVTVVGCSPVPDEGPVIETDGRTADQTGTDVTQIVTRDGKKRAEIHAHRLLKYDRERVSYLEEGVRVRFFTGCGREVSTLVARRARIDETERILTAMDSVVLVNLDETTLRTDTLRWEEGAARVFGPGRVTIDRREGTEVGVGFEAESDLSSWTLHEVVTRLSLPDSGK